MAKKPITFIKHIDLTKEASKALDKDLNDYITPLTETAIKERTPVVTSRLQGSMTGRRLGFLDYEVATNVIYALYVEYGGDSKRRFTPRAMMRRGGEHINKNGLQYLKNLNSLLK